MQCLFLILLFFLPGKFTPKAVIAVDLFGLPATFEAIRKIADKYGLLVLEDGGAVFTDDDNTARLLESIRVHGKGEMKYDNVRIRLNSRLDTIQAAILSVKLKAFRDYELADINKAADRYTEALMGIVKTPIIPKGFYSSWAQYTIQLENKEARDNLQTALKKQGIPSMVYYPKPMHKQEAFDGMAVTIGSLDNTIELCDTVLSLPMHPYLKDEDDEDIEKVVEVIKTCVK